MGDEKIRHRFTIKLFNGEEGDDENSLSTVMAVVDAPDVATWAKDEMGTIEGTRWESDGDDFVVAMFPNTPGVINRIKAEGYLIDASEFVEAT